MPTIYNGTLNLSVLFGLILVDSQHMATTPTIEVIQVRCSFIINLINVNYR